MRVIEMRALAVESLAAVLFLVGAFRQADMRLACELPFLSGYITLLSQISAELLFALDGFE